MSMSSANTLISPSAASALARKPYASVGGNGVDDAASTTSAGGAPATSPAATTSSTHSRTKGHARTHSVQHGAHHGRRSAHTAHGHGHGHGHAHTSHSSHGHARGNANGRRSSEGESGRRALAAGLTMQVLDAAAAGAVPKIRRKTSDNSHGHGHGHGHGHHVHTSRAHAVHHAHPRTSRSETNLARLSRTPSSSGVSALTDSTGGTGTGTGTHGLERARSRSSRRRMQEEEIQVIEDDAAAAEDAEEGEWESGDETPARHRSVSNPAEAMYRRVSEASTRSAQEQQPQQPQDEPVVSPDAVAAAPTPRDPPATQRTTGFPGARAPLTPASIASVSAGATSQSEHSPAASTVGSAALEVTTKPAATRTRDGFPFPEMPRDREHEDGADGAKETHTDDHASVAAASPQRERRVPSTQTGIQRSRVPSMPAQTLTKQASYTSLRSLRAPHPLNSHDNRTEASKRMSSIHCPPAAPAVVYRETVGGHGWDEAVASPTSATGAPDTPVTPQGCRTERIGSFSSVRSLKGVLSTSSASPRTPTFSSGTGPRHPSRRLTALQAASAAARLNTTSDTVAYHQSLGFSAATAETAHLLSRFLPPKAPHRPGWVITTREAIEAHAAAERGELHEYRLGLTDGQYRDAHESLVHTLKEIKAQQPRGRARSSYYGYGALLGGAANAAAQPFSADAAAVPVGAGDGQTPFELSVARCLTQRPKFVV